MNYLAAGRPGDFARPYGDWRLFRFPRRLCRRVAPRTGRLAARFAAPLADHLAPLGLAVAGRADSSQLPGGQARPGRVPGDGRRRPGKNAAMGPSGRRLALARIGHAGAPRRRRTGPQSAPYPTRCRPGPSPVPEIASKPDSAGGPFLSESRCVPASTPSTSRPSRPSP